MRAFKKFISNDNVFGDKFQQQGNSNKLIIHRGDGKSRLFVTLILAPLVVGLLLLIFEYFGFVNLDRSL